MKKRMSIIKEEKEEKLDTSSNISHNVSKRSSQKPRISKNTKNKIIQKKTETEEEIDIEAQEKLRKEKEKAELKRIIKILKIEKEKKTREDIKELKEYLPSHFTYFKNILNQSEERLVKLIPLLKYESFRPNERLMNFGDEGDKCYLLLQGSVGIYKPFPITTKMTLREYVEYLVKIRDEEKNQSKFERIMNYNSRIDKNQLYLIDFNPNRVPKYSASLTIVIEEERELAKGVAGSSFGEMALIKNEPRNASIVALEKCSLISIDKVDYNKIMKDFEEQRVIRELLEFKESYPIFKFWPSAKCFPLLSGFITQEFAKDDYVYRQNDFPSSIYIIKEGIFEISTNFNFETYERYIEYIHDTSYSLIPYIDNPAEWKEDKNARRIENAFQKNLSPFIVNLEIEDKIILSHKEEDSARKKDIAQSIEDELERNKKHIFKSNIQNLHAPDIFGFVEALELKQRLTNVKCISPKGVLMKFTLREFLQLLPTDKRNNFYLQQRIFEEKKYIISQLKNTAMAKLNFVKVNINKDLYISKNFFIPKPKKKNLLYFKHKLDNLKNSKVLPPGSLNHKQLVKSNSLMNYNISKIENNSKFFLNDSMSASEEKKLPIIEPIKGSSRNSYIRGFKNSILNLTKNKIKEIKNLYPLQETRNKSSFLNSSSIKEIDNSKDDYVKYLGNNMQYAITPHKALSNDLSDLSLMTGKKYVSLEADKIIKEMGKKKKLMRVVTLAQKNEGIILPKINFTSRKNRKNKSDFIKVKQIKFSTVNI